MANTIKKPITNGVTKPPVMIQLEAVECGAVSLCMILAYYDKWISLEEARLTCGVSRDGSSAGNLLRAARGYGLEADGFTCEPDELREYGQFPCIIHWDFNHFVVLDGFKKDKAYINDPALGSYSLSMEEFDKHFTGVCLMFEPGEDFEPEGHKPNMLVYAKNQLMGNGKALVFFIITTIIVSIFGIVSPYFSQVFLDEILPGKRPEWLAPFMIALGIVVVIEIVVAWIDSIYSLKLNGRMSAKGTTDFFWKVLNLPMAFFSQRNAGDIADRQTYSSLIARTIVETFAPLLLNAAMLVFYLVAMFRNNWILSLIGIASVGINTFLSMVVSRRRVNFVRISMRDQGKLSSTTVTGLDMIETLKASGAEHSFFIKWSGYQAKIKGLEVEFNDKNYFLVQISDIVSTIVDIAVLLLGVYFVIRGSYTIGLLMAFQGFLSGFIDPANSLIDAGQTIEEMRANMERVNDVMEYEEDDVFAPESDEIPEGQGKLTGNIELKDVSFGYSILKDPLIRDFNLTLKPGKQVAIVGGSGCGKSTVAKLIAGIYQPWSGEILFDGKPMKEIDKIVFKSSVAVVDQDFVLFEDSISDNIKMWDESIEDFEVIMAARDAHIHDAIMDRPGGYKYKVKQGGANFSGGQCQRLVIARTLAQDPTIVIMDEATSALDARTEYEVVTSIRERGCACIVIAHRLSTIRDSDEIIVLDKGEVCGRGTHDELYKNNEIYRNLVASE